jgi:integrase
MEKPKPPYLIRREGRGNTFWYYWKRPGPQLRIRGEYGSREFWENYEAAASSGVSRKPTEKKDRLPADTLAWLIERYRESSSWTQLSPATRKQRENIFLRVKSANPDLEYRDVDRPMVIQTRDKMADRPSAANHFIEAIKGLFNWAVDAGFVNDNPTTGVKNIKRPNTGGFRQWTEEDILAFKHRWPVGTRERMALEIFINTGLRRGDAARLGRQHVRNGRIKIVTEKTNTQIDIPAPRELLRVIDKTMTGDLVFIANSKNGKPMSKAGLGNWFGEAAEKAGVDGSNCHGLRKAAATRLAEAGATIHELNAVFGWSGTAMAARYTQAASRKTLADSAAAKLGADN